MEILSTGTLYHAVVGGGIKQRTATYLKATMDRVTWGLKRCSEMIEIVLLLLAMRIPTKRSLSTDQVEFREASLDAEFVELTRCNAEENV